MVTVSPASRLALETIGLTKQFGAVRALTDLSLSVPRGTTYGFLGPNGAGKTTTIKLLLGFIRPTAGQASIGGCDSWSNGPRARADLGFLVQPDNLFADMTGEAHLAFAATLSGRSPSLRDTLLEVLDLAPEALQRKLGTYSKGMRQKLALIAAMQCDPGLLILDEPTDGLDPLVQHGFEQLLHDLERRGRTIFMSSHDLAEVERTCELVAVVKQGRLVIEASIDELKRMHRRRASARFPGGIPPDLDTIPGAQFLAREGDRVDFLVDGDTRPLLELFLRNAVEDVVIAPASLDDIFLDYYGAAGETSSSNAVPTRAAR